MPSSNPSAESAPRRRVSIASLETFMQQAFINVGLPTADAKRVAALMTEADARGSEGHGSFRMPSYVRRIKAGGINLKPNIRIERDMDSTALIDGDNAMGHLVMSRAAEVAIAKAKKTGIGWVGVKQSNHAGPAFLYARMPLAHDMIGLYAAIGNANHAAPWGGVDMLLSTNPLAIAVPSGKRPAIVLDMATTVAAYGKVKTKAQRGELMPEGWMIDRLGKPLTDPNRASEGSLLPIGGPKGYGLSLMLGLLAGTLNGAAFGRDVIDFNADFKTTTNTGQLICALDIGGFMDVAHFKTMADEVWAQMKSSATLPGVDQVRLPGERNERTYQRSLKEGVQLHAEHAKALDKLADELGIGRI